MNFSPFGLTLLAWTALSGMAPAADLTVQSGPARAHLLELFTSEGCSSCPPAERWFSTLRESPRLWRDIVPVAFHVDYWDNLGWKDPLASRASSERQRAYASAWGAGTVYTPGFVLDGREWRGSSLNVIPESGAEVGHLVAKWRDDGAVEIAYQPAAKSGKWQAHAALLGFGVSFDVKAGENSGRRLVHDFVALDEQSAGLNKDGDSFRATLRLPVNKVRRGQSALVVWITEASSLEPVQAAGGNL